MGNVNKRVFPKIANYVNRDLDNLMVHSIILAIKKLNSPWERNYMGRPCWSPKVVATCCFIKIFFNRTYDGTEAYLKANSIVSSSESEKTPKSLGKLFKEHSDSLA